MNKIAQKIAVMVGVLALGSLLYAATSSSSEPEAGLIAPTAADTKEPAVGKVAGTLKGPGSLDRSTAVVYLTGKALPKASPPKKHPRIVQGKDGSLSPSILPVGVGWAVDFVSRAPAKKKEGDPPPKPVVRTATFSRAGVTRVMDFANPAGGTACVVALETPYFRMAKKDGSFSLDGIPAGKYKVQVWHPTETWAPAALEVRKGKTTTLAVAFGRAVQPPPAKKTGGIITGKIKVRGVRSPKDVVVYIERAKGTFKPPAKPVKMDQQKMVFVPHVLPIVKGTTVAFQNNDSVPHNVFSPDKVADEFNLGTWKAGEARNYTFKKLGSAAILCNIHPEMEAYVVILQNPYFAVVDAKGNYTIENVPPGEYTLKTWHWKLKTADKKVKVVKGKTVQADFSLRK